MRRLFILATVALLGILPLVVGRASVAAQEGEETTFDIITTDDVAWQSVSRPRPVTQEAPSGGAGTTPIKQLQQYEVYFGEEWAGVPVIENAELMVVVVEQGTFVLDLAPDEVVAPSGPATFVVHPSDEAAIPTMTRLAVPPDPGPYYEPTGVNVKDASGDDCTSMCLIPEKEIVQVKPGDTILAREGAICIWCLINQDGDPEGDQGLLLVTPVVSATGFDTGEFSWVSSWDAAAAGSEITTVQVVADGTTSMSGEPVKMGWAYFNPGPGCHRGHG
jgi:hypothetical protein